VKRSGDHELHIADLKREVARFIAERDWEQFHTPENLALSLSLEAAELLEIFQWKLGARDERQDKEREKGKQGKVGGTGYTQEELAAMQLELADILIYLISFFNRMGWDIASSLQRKLEMNKEKYPASLFKGKFEIKEEGR